MDLTVKVPDQLAAEARARGVSVEVYVQEILSRQVPAITSEQQLESIRGAIDKIIELRKGSKLAPLKIKDLTHEGHKY